MKVKKSVIRKILTAYFDLKFPASFQSVSKFKESLKRNLNIDISHYQLRKILKNNAYYQSNITKKSKFLMRKLYTQGVTIVGFADSVFVPLPNGKLFKFLIVADAASKFAYGTFLKQVNPKELQRAFKQLFRSGTPYFSILRVDRDLSLGTMTKFFADRKILLRQKRGKSHLIFLENIIFAQ